MEKLFTIMELIYFLYFNLVVVLVNISHIHGQNCSMFTDCHPPSQNLLTGIGTTYLNRTLITDTTCGLTGTTIYQKSSSTWGLDIPEDYYCNATFPHGQELMYDRIQKTEYLTEGDLTTYWQSDNAILKLDGVPVEKSVTLELGDKFLLRYFSVVFISPFITSSSDNSDMRPLAMIFEKKSEVTSQWEPLRFYADNCARHFPGVNIQYLNGTGPDFPATEAVCIERYYGGDASTFTGWGFGRQEVGDILTFLT